MLSMPWGSKRTDPQFNLSKMNDRCEPGIAPQFWQLLSALNSLPLHNASHFSDISICFFFFFFFPLKVVRHYLCLTETQGRPLCPGPPGEQVVRAKAHQEPGPSAAHLNLPAFYPGLPLLPSSRTGTRFESSLETDRPSDIFTANLFPPPPPTDGECRRVRLLWVYSKEQNEV